MEEEEKKASLSSSSAVVGKKGGRGDCKLLFPISRCLMFDLGTLSVKVEKELPRLERFSYNEKVASFKKVA